MSEQMEQRGLIESACVQKVAARLVRRGDNPCQAGAQHAAPLQQLQGVHVDEEGRFGDLFGVGVGEGSGEEIG